MFIQSNDYKKLSNAHKSQTDWNTDEKKKYEIEIKYNNPTIINIFSSDWKTQVNDLRTKGDLRLNLTTAEQFQSGVVFLIIITPIFFILSGMIVLLKAKNNNNKNKNKKPTMIL
jgi:hypothetical protein